METRTSVFDQGPFELLHKIVGAFSPEAGADRRATVTVHTASAKSWTGVPTSFVNNRSGEFFIFSFKDKPQSLALAAQQIVGVEVDDVRALDAFLTKPWTSDPDFASVTKLQAARDLVTLWGDAKPKVFIHFDTFPAVDEAPGFTIAWTKRLKGEIEKIRQEFGDKEISAIQTVEVKYERGSMTCTKQGHSLLFTIDLSTESLDRKALASRLSDVL